MMIVHRQEGMDVIANQIAVVDNCLDQFFRIGENLLKGQSGDIGQDVDDQGCDGNSIRFFQVSCFLSLVFFPSRSVDPIQNHAHAFVCVCGGMIGIHL